MAIVYAHYRTGATLTYGAVSVDGTTLVTAAGTSLPESTQLDGYYAVVDNNVIVSDSIVIQDGTNVVAGGLYENPDVANAVWNEVISKANYNVGQSAGKILRESDISVTSDDAQGPGTGNNQIQLATSASTVDGAYDPARVFIKTGTGAGQSRNIIEYTGATRTATVDRNWKVNPDSSSEYVVLADAGREHVNEGLAQAGTATTLTLNALASSIDNAYRNQLLFIRSGTGDDQVRRVISYDGTTKIATVSRVWGTTPDSTSGYVILPMACVEVQAIKEVELQDNVGPNFDTFFENDSNTTSVIVDDIESTGTTVTRISAIQEADKQLDDSTTPWSLKYKTKGTSTVLLKKNLTDIDDVNVTSTEQIIATETDATP